MQHTGIWYRGRLRVLPEELAQVSVPDKWKTTERIINNRVINGNWICKSTKRLTVEELMYKPSASLYYVHMQFLAISAAAVLWMTWGIYNWWWRRFNVSLSLERKKQYHERDNQLRSKSPHTLWKKIQANQKQNKHAKKQLLSFLWFTPNCLKLKKGLITVSNNHPVHPPTHAHTYTHTHIHLHNALPTSGLSLITYLTICYDLSLEYCLGHFDSFFIFHLCFYLNICFYLLKIVERC